MYRSRAISKAQPKHGRHTPRTPDRRTLSFRHELITAQYRYMLAQWHTLILHVPLIPPLDVPHSPYWTYSSKSNSKGSSTRPHAMKGPNEVILSCADL